MLRIELKQLISVVLILLIGLIPINSLRIHSVKQDNRNFPEISSTHEQYRTSPVLTLHDVYN